MLEENKKGNLYVVPAGMILYFRSEAQTILIIYSVGFVAGK
jgi:hypothetical protein